MLERLVLESRMHESQMLFCSLFSRHERVDPDSDACIAGTACARIADRAGI